MKLYPECWPGQRRPAGAWAAGEVTAISLVKLPADVAARVCWWELHTPFPLLRQN